MHVVIGVAHGAVVALPEDWAYEHAQLKKARETSATWGEFKAACPARYWRELRENFAAFERRVPRGSAPFVWFNIPYVADGDWPSWPEQEMLSWIPEDILIEVGEEKMSTLNGNFAHVAEGDAARLVGRLTRAGFRCIRNDQFIRYLCDDASQDA